MVSYLEWPWPAAFQGMDGIGRLIGAKGNGVWVWVGYPVVDIWIWVAKRVHRRLQRFVSCILVLSSSRGMASNGV